MIEKFFLKNLQRGEGNREKRDNRIIKAIYASVTARFINIASGLITVPITLSYLGVDLFGIWMTVTSLVAFLNFTDFGLGIGLQNALSKCYGQEDKKNPKGYISSTLFLMVLICLLLIFAAVYILPFIPADKLVKFKSPDSTAQILPAVQAVVFVFALGLPASLIQRVLNGYQLQHISNYLLVIGRILGLCGILVCVYFEQSLFVLVLVFIGSPYLVMIVYSIGYFYKHVWLRPQISRIKINFIRDVSNSGIWAVLAQVAYTLRINIPIFIISSCVGSVAVSSFTITQKLLGISGMFLNLALQTLWPAYGEAYFRGDKEWIENTLYRSIKIVLSISVPMFFVVLFFGKTIIEKWTGNTEIVPSWSLLVSCNVWSFLLGLNITYSMVLNGSNNFRGQGTYGLFLTVMACLAGYFYSVRFEAAGVVWTMVVLGELALLVFLKWEVVSVLKNMKEKKCIHTP